MMAGNFGHWLSRSPRRARAMLVVAIILVAGTLAWWFAPEPVARRESVPPPVGNVLTAADPKELGLSALARELRALRGEVTALRQAQATPPEAPADRGELSALVQDMARIRAELDTLRAPPRPSAPEPPPPMPSAPIADFRIVDEDSEPVPKRESDAHDQHDYLPAGTLITGRLLYGMDASTAAAAIRQPQPVVVRIQHQAILPNRARFDVRECFLTAGGYGELSSERVMLRTENLSCVRADGGVVDVKLEAVAVGEDGKVGLRGRLVDKQGRSVGLAGLAGLAEGASQALGSRGTIVTTGAGAELLTQSGSRGFSSSLDRIAEFYLERADRLSPVLELAGSREVTFALVRGVSLATAVPARERGGS